MDLTIVAVFDAMTAAKDAAASLSASVAAAADPSALMGQVVATREAARAALALIDEMAVMDSAGPPGEARIGGVVYRTQARRDLVDVCRLTLAVEDAVREAQSRQPRRRTRIVRAGDTLQSIARDELGDWTLWAGIATANGLDPGATLTVGSELLMPERT